MSRRYPGVYKRGKYYYWTWQDKKYTHGKQIHHGGHYRTAAEAYKARKEYIDKVMSRSPSYEKYKEYDVEALCWWFIHEHDEINNRKTTVAKTRSMVTCHIVPAVGNINIYELNNQDILRFKNDYILHETESTAYNSLRILKRILNRAVAEDILTYSPFKTRLPSAPRTEHPTVDPLILKDMLFELHGVDRAIIATAGMQGRRNGETEGLQWGDLDFNTLTMHIRRQSVKGEIVFHLKSRKGKKELVIPMTVMYMQMMKEWKLEAKPSEWVFPGRYSNRPMRIDSWRNRYWKGIKKHYGLPARLRPHDLRHSFATFLIAAGVKLSIVQEIMGHASINITKDLYGHLEIEHLREGMGIIDKLFDMPKEVKKPRGG